MPKLKQREASQTVRAVMEKRGFSPIEKLMAMVDEEIPLPDGGKETLGSYLQGGYLDYEPSPNKKTLRLRASLRAKILMELASFANPKLRASEETPAIGNITVEIRNFTEPPRPLTVSRIE